MQPVIDMPGSTRRRKPMSPRGLRILMAFLAADGLLFAGIAVYTFLTQDSQVAVTAQLLAEQCAPKLDSGTHTTEIRCTALVQFTTRTREVVTTTITDACPCDFSEHGQFTTINLRYGSDPTRPYKPSDYMDPVTVSVLLGFGSTLATLSIWGFRRADRIVERVAARADAPARMPAWLRYLRAWLIARRS